MYPEHDRAAPAFILFSEKFFILISTTSQQLKNDESLTGCTSQSSSLPSSRWKEPCLAVHPVCPEVDKPRRYTEVYKLHQENHFAM